MKFKPRQNVIAIVYDFDGTLSPENMQESTIFKEYDIDKDVFWEKALRLSVDEQYERTLAYLKLLIFDPVFLENPLTRSKLKAMARTNIRYFKGVEEYFSNMKLFINRIEEARDLDIRIDHYIISSGLMEILSSCSIARHFKKIYACEFEYVDDHPVFPKLVINDTNKTQFLFRINKGKLDLSEDINSHMPADERPIPFRNMIYLGDGTTDIPSMTVMQKSGGHAIGVFPPDRPVPEEVKAMVADGRADHFAPADFSEDGLLVKVLHKAILKIVQEISYRASSGLSKDWVKRNP